MSRTNLPPELVAALSREHVEQFLLLEIQLDSGTQRLATTPFDVSWDGHTYRGAAGIGSIEPVSETTHGASGLRFVLPLVNQAAIASAMTERLHGRRVILRAAWVDRTTNLPSLLVDPAVWIGELDASELEIYSPKPKLIVTAEHDMHARWDRASNTAASDDEHQRLRPGDGVYRYAAETAGARIVWPAREWFTK